MTHCALGTAQEENVANTNLGWTGIASIGWIVGGVVSFYHLGRLTSTLAPAVILEAIALYYTILGVVHTKSA